MAFADFAEEWLTRTPDLRDSSRRNYGLTLHRYSIPYFGRRKLGSITPRDIANFAAHLNDPEAQRCRQLAPATIANAVAPLRSMFRAAVNEGVIRSNPTRDVRLPRPRRTEFSEADEEGAEVKALTREQLAMLLRLIPSKHRLLFEFLASTGLRRSEASGLEWRHLDPNSSAPMVRVRRQRYRGLITDVKTKTSRRDVPLSIHLADKLAAAKTETGATETDPVFAGHRKDAPLDFDNVRRGPLRLARAELGLDWLGFHSLRHTCASLLFERDASPVAVARVLGHASPSVTMQVYAHWIRREPPAALDLGAELMEANLTFSSSVLSPSHGSQTTEEVGL